MVSQKLKEPHETDWGYRPSSSIELGVENTLLTKFSLAAGKFSLILQEMGAVVGSLAM